MFLGKEIIFNPKEPYNALAEGDKKALAHLVKAGKILNNAFIKQEHYRGLEFKAELEKRTSKGDKLAEKTLELYNIFNGIQDERKERRCGDFAQTDGGTTCDLQTHERRAGNRLL